MHKLSRNANFLVFEGLLNLGKQDYNLFCFVFSLLLIWILFNTLFPFCELSYACAKCFSSGPLVIPGPIFMNHREQALARIRLSPAPLKHKRDKHKGIWSSLLTRVEISPASQSLLPDAASVFSKNCTKWVLPFFLLVSCYLRRKKMHLNVDLSLEMCKCSLVCIIFVFLSPFFSWNMHCLSVLSSLNSNAVSFLRLFLL